MKFAKKAIAIIALSTSVNVYADGIEWSGFGSLYYSQAFDNQMLVGGHDNNKPDFTSQSLLGLNVGSRITDDMTIASQIIMAGSDAQSTNFNMYAQWAYLNYKVADGLNFKIGRQLWPVQISSEYQRVHQLLPQSNIPSTAYRLLPFVAFDGASLNKTMNVGLGDLTIGAYFGNPKLNTTPPPILGLDFQTLVGARVTLDGSGWRLHSSYNRVFSKVRVSVPYVTSTPNQVSVIDYTGKTHTDILSFGYRFDKHNFVSWGEIVHSKATDDSKLSNPAAGNLIDKKLYDKTYGGYVLVGYRIGKFLPSLTYAQGTTHLGLPADTVRNPPAVANFEGKTTSYIVGTAYAMNDQATARVEYQRTYVPSVGGGWYDVQQTTASTKKYGDAVKAGIDFIF